MVWHDNSHIKVELEGNKTLKYSQLRYKCARRPFQRIALVISSIGYRLEGSKYLKLLYEKSNTPFSYMLCLFCKKPIGELNLKRALDEDTGVSSFFFSSLSYSSPLGHDGETRFYVMNYNYQHLTLL